MEPDRKRRRIEGYNYDNHSDKIDIGKYIPLVVAFPERVKITLARIKRHIDEVISDPTNINERGDVLNLLGNNRNFIVTVLKRLIQEENSTINEKYINATLCSIRHITNEKFIRGLYEIGNIIPFQIALNVMWGVRNYQLNIPREYYKYIDKQIFLDNLYHRLIWHDTTFEDLPCEESEIVVYISNLLVNDRNAISNIPRTWTEQYPYFLDIVRYDVSLGNDYDKYEDHSINFDEKFDLKYKEKFFNCNGKENLGMNNSVFSLTIFVRAIKHV